jgi:hypothetical protein
MNYNIRAFFVDTLYYANVCLDRPRMEGSAPGFEIRKQPVIGSVTTFDVFTVTHTDRHRHTHTSNDS